MPEFVESINDTARMARTMLSLLLVAAVVVVLMLSFSTDETLFRNVPVELPQVGIGISIKQGYILAPLIFLYLHIQMLYLLGVLARKMRPFMQEQKEEDEGEQQRHFDELSAFAFIQLFGERSLSSPLPWFLIWFGVVAIPLMLLFAMGLSFVRFQSDAITWGHRVIFVIDLVFVLWFVWAVLPRTSMLDPYDQSRESRVVGCMVHAIRARVRLVVRAMPARVRLVVRAMPTGMILILLVPVAFIDLVVYQSNEIIYFIISIIICSVLVVWSIELRCPDFGSVGCIIQEVPCEMKSLIDGMKLLTTVVAIFVVFFLFHSVRPPLFDPETVEEDRKCIWRYDDKKKRDMTEEDTPCCNYIDRFLCKSLDICRYLDLRKKWLASTQSVDLTGFIPDELGDENAMDSRWSVNDLHVTDRNFRFADFHSAELYGANFSRAKLEGANFRRAQLHSAIFEGAQLRNTNFGRSGAKDSNFSESKSQSANFEFAMLRGASFSNAQLQGSNFEDAKLTGAFFRGTGLQGVNFKSARLHVTDFGESELQGVNFEDAELYGTELYMANLQGANFSGARLEGVDLGDAQLQCSFVVEDIGSWSLVWMPDVSFSFCNPVEQYNEILHKLEETDYLDIKLAWDKNERGLAWDKLKDRGKRLEDQPLEEHFNDYLMPDNINHTKLGCKLLQENENVDSIICFESGDYNSTWEKRATSLLGEKWMKNLPGWMSKLACKNGYTANRIFSRWTKNSDILSKSSSSHNVVLIEEIEELRKRVFEILDRERQKKDKSRCPGLQSIPDGKWSRWRAIFDVDRI